MNSKQRSIRNISLSLLIIFSLLFRLSLAHLVIAEDATSSAEPTSEQDAVLVTGDAYASASATTIANTNLINSTLETDYLDVTATDSADISLFSDSNQVGSSSAQIVVSENYATVSATVMATADTGHNLQTTNGSSTLVTGDAYASAHATAVINTNLFQSYLGLSLVNVFEEWDGDIFLPSLTELSSVVNHASPSAVYNQNQAVITDWVVAEANSGNNIQSDSQSSLITGDATSITSAKTIVNANLVNTFLFEFVVNNINLWQGEIINFLYPGSRQNPTGFLSYLSTSVASSSAFIQNSTQNNTQSSTVAKAKANTGFNTQISENSQMQTGHAFAAAHTTTITNTNLTFSRYLFGQINLFKPWTGDLIFGHLEESADDSPAQEPKAEEPAIGGIGPRSNTIDTKTNPEIRLNTKNNINDFVYPGDHVRYTVVVKNTGDTPLSDIIFEQSLNTPEGRVLDKVRLPLKGLDVGKGLKLEFELALKDSLSSGIYLTPATVTAKYQDQTVSASNSNTVKIISKSNPLFSLTIPETSTTTLTLNQDLDLSILGAKTSLPRRLRLMYLLVLPLLVLFRILLSRRVKTV